MNWNKANLLLPNLQFVKYLVLSFAGSSLTWHSLIKLIGLFGIGAKKMGILFILTNLNLPPIQYIRKLTHLQMLTSQMEGDDSKPADDDDREGVAEGQHGQGLLQHGLQINPIIPSLFLNSIYPGGGKFAPLGF